MDSYSFHAPSGAMIIKSCSVRWFQKLLMPWKAKIYFESQISPRKQFNNTSLTFYALNRFFFVLVYDAKYAPAVWRGGQNSKSRAKDSTVFSNQPPGSLKARMSQPKGWDIFPSSPSDASPPSHGCKSHTSTNHRSHHWGGELNSKSRAKGSPEFASNRASWY
ncbi:hypothetical protein AVEN_78232-1 [Araneus ventricosus]|uniref:Uncharacterized protein n=1 Tax=Araneus ventricosus TaxID=182803 RepID=A0A4Y2LLX6_ARAVE|nr:hypothetical protein AVEN_78232-1 [Araneus ventricosus]